MKVTTIFLLAVVVALCYCWTVDGHKHAGKRDDKRGLQNHHKGHHLDVVISPLVDRRQLQCKCVPRNPQHLQRDKRPMRKLHKRNPRGRRCHCKQLSRISDISIPLS